MSQMEQSFRQFLSSHPEIEKCYSSGLINRRSLVRYLIGSGVVKKADFEAAVGMIRRFPISKQKSDGDELFSDMRITLKDNISVLSFEKSKELVKKLQQVIAHTDYDRGDTLKIVIGSSLVKVFIDEEKEKKLKDILEDHKVKSKTTKITEISIQFAEDSIKTKGILSTITREFSLNDIVITELLTASPELLIYVSEEFVLKSYQILKNLKT